MRGIAGGFIQVCHGKEGPLKRMKKGDMVIVYSSKESMHSDSPLQSFTAIGAVVDDSVYTSPMTPQFVPYRRRVHYLQCKETPIHPLINALNFIPDKKRWGYPFRYGLLETDEHDYLLISKLMIDEEP